MDENLIPGSPYAAGRQMVLVEKVVATAQDRMTFRTDKIEELADSMASGQAQPIKVRPHTDIELRAQGVLLIVFGERRLRASKLLGWSHIDALVEDLDDRAAALAQWQENQAREDLNPLERGYAIKRRMEAEGITSEKEASRLLGIPTTSLHEYLLMTRLIPQAQALIVSKDLTIGYGKVMAVLGPDYQAAAVRHLTRMKVLNLEAFTTYCRGLRLAQDQGFLWAEDFLQPVPTPSGEGYTELFPGWMPTTHESNPNTEGPYAPHPDLPSLPRGRTVRIMLERSVEYLSQSDNPVWLEAARVLRHTYLELDKAHKLR